jgi:hypothetical protein
LAGDDVYYSRRSAWGRSYYKLGVLLISHKPKASQGRHRTRASECAYGYTAHLLEIEPIASTQTGQKCGRIGLLPERPLDVRDDAVVVRVETE